MRAGRRSSTRCRARASPPRRSPTRTPTSCASSTTRRRISNRGADGGLIVASLVALKDVSKTFDNGTLALDRVDFAVAKGEFVSLLGPSGCGKSTALRIVAGLLKPTDGTVAFAPAKPEIGFVFQEPTLMPWGSALTNARLPLDLKGVSRSEADDRAAKALKRVGLGGFEKSFPRELSGGMK